MYDFAVGPFLLLNSVAMFLLRPRAFRVKIAIMKTPTTIDYNGQRISTDALDACPGEDAYSGEEYDSPEFAVLPPRESDLATPIDSDTVQSVMFSPVPENVDQDSSDLAREIGAKIRGARLKTRKLSRPKLAERMNIPTSRLREIEEGRTRASEMEIWLASLHIGCPLHELVPTGKPPDAAPIPLVFQQNDTLSSDENGCFEGDDPFVTDALAEPAARLASRLRRTLRRHTSGTRFDSFKSERVD